MDAKCGGLQERVERRPSGLVVGPGYCKTLVVTGSLGTAEARAYLRVKQYEATHQSRTGPR